MSDTAELLRRGIAAAKAGQYKQARDLLTQVVELDESNEQAWLWLSGLVESLDDRRLCLENVLAVNPGNVHAQTGLRRIEAALARSSGEGKGFGQESAPRSSTPAPPAGDGAGAPLLREREGSEQRSIASSPQPSPRRGKGVEDDPVSLVDTAQSYIIKMQNIPRAIDLLDRALKLQPANSHAYLLLGDAYLQQDNVAQAARYYSHAHRHAAPDTRVGREARLKLTVLQESARSGAVPTVTEHAGVVSTAGTHRALEEPYTYGYAGRPGCVTLYAALSALAGFLALLGGVTMAIAGPRLVSSLQENSMPLIQGYLEDAQGLLGTATWVAAGLGLLTAVVSLAIAAGLWRMKNWARIVVIVITVLGVSSVVCPVVVVSVGLSNIFATSLLAGLPVWLLAIPLAALVLVCSVIYWFAANRELFE